MAVTEEADGRLEVLKHVESLDLSKNIGVFVERRSMGDRENITHCDGSFWERSEPLAVPGEQLILGPARGLERDFVEHLAVVDAATHLIVIASDDDRTFELADSVNNRIRIGAVADEVAEDDGSVEVLATYALQHRGKRFEVRVDVAQYEISHESLR